MDLPPHLENLRIPLKSKKKSGRPKVPWELLEPKMFERLKDGLAEPTLEQEVTWIAKWAAAKGICAISDNTNTAPITFAQVRNKYHKRYSGGAKGYAEIREWHRGNLENL
jgi:hypothetical protein